MKKTKKSYKKVAKSEMKKVKGGAGMPVADKGMALIGAYAALRAKRS